MEALTVEKLTFYYGTSCVLDEVSFSVSSGLICGLLGPNGSGKTTLLKCINGIYKPATGCVKVNNVALDQLDRQEIARKMSVVPQQTNSVFAFKVADMVVMGRSPTFEIWQAPSPSDRVDAVNLLKDLGIGHLAERRFNEISGGERQMVLLARAIFQNTQIMLLDEPTSHLDLKNQVKIIELVKSVTVERGITTIMTLHDPNLALYNCDEVVLLKSGRITGIGKTDQILIDENLSNIYELNVNVEVTQRGKKVIIPECWQEKNTYQERSLVREKVQ
ncbi:MAG: ABC transporter ATP-binding protein [Syntrophaceticus sp.]|nr:ABC transporter ATP-binding protein [Syntrophaceticus sp.]